MRAGPQLATPPLMMLTMGEACDGPCLLDLPVPEGGGIRSTPLEAAPAAERLEIMDTEYVALSDELVVEVWGVVHGDLDLDLTIRIRNDCGEAHEVCNDALELAALHTAPEERSSDAVSDLPAGAKLGNSRAAVRTDDETSGGARSESMSGTNDRNDLSGEGAVRPGICHGRAFAPAGSHSRRR